MNSMKKRIAQSLAFISAMLFVFSGYGVSHAADAETSSVIFYVT